MLCWKPKEKSWDSCGFRLRTFEGTRAQDDLSQGTLNPVTMPELPHVEAVARHLRRFTTGRRVTRVEVRDRSVVRSPAPRLFRRRLCGRRIQAIGRRGKYLLLS